MNNDSHSDSLFTSSTSKDDVRHDVNTVQEAWAQEQRRRTKKALLIILPAIAAVIAAYFIFVHFNPQYDFSHLSDPLLSEEEFQHLEMEENGTLPPPPPDTTVTESFGNPDAKLKLSVAGFACGDELRNLLLEAVDSKPSEIHLTLLAKKEFTEEERGFMKGSGSSMLSFNGQKEFDFTMPNGMKRKIYFDGQYGVIYNADDVILIISHLFETIYGKPAIPVYAKYPALYEKLKKEIIPYQQEQQTFNALPAPQEIK